MAIKINDATYGLYCVQPDQLLPVTIANYFNLHLGITNKFVNVFGTNIYPYRRTDQGTVSLPLLNIYPLRSHKTGDLGYLTGVIRCEIGMPVNLNRQRITEAAMTLYNNLTFLMTTDDFLSYINTYVPFLREFDWDTTNNFDPLYAEQNLTNYRFYKDVNYMVDLTAFYFYLNNNGLNILDPCIQSGFVERWDLFITTISTGAFLLEDGSGGLILLENGEENIGLE